MKKYVELRAVLCTGNQTRIEISARYVGIKTTLTANTAPTFFIEINIPQSRKVTKQIFGLYLSMRICFNDKDNVGRTI